jgi:uncharacterized membrane protein
MSIKKVLAFVVMLAALVAIFAGISYANNYTSQTSTQNPVFADSITVQVNGTGQIYIKLNATEADHYVSLKINNGSIRGAVISPEEYAAWVNGSYKPAWQYDQPSTWWGSGEYVPMMSNAPQERYYIFWNPDAPVSREVTLKICEQTTETTYNCTTLGTGIFLIAAGTVAGSVAAYALGRRLLLTLVAFALIVLGAFLVSTYPKTFEGKENVAMDSLTVPAGSSINEPVHYNTSDYYAFTLSGPNGRLNTTVIPEANYTEFLEGKYYIEYWQMWQGSHYPINGMLMGGIPFGSDVRLVLVNPESYDERVSVQVNRLWIGTDYSGTAGGFLLVALGVIVLYVAHRRQIGEFNKALENQE